MSNATAPHGDVASPPHAGSSTVRVCDEPDCETRLSRYNEFEFCALHQPMVVPRMRGKVL